MKEMIYEAYRKEAEILCDKQYRGYRFLVVSYGTNPCGYVELKEGQKYYGCEDYEFDVDVHGGLTWAGGLRFTDGWFIGWDYAHYNDFCGYDDDRRGYKRWTTQEIINEAKSVIDQLIDLGN